MQRNIYLIIAILAIVVGILLCALNRLKGFRKNKKELFRFFVAISGATFVAFLALYIGTLNGAKQEPILNQLPNEKQVTVDLLSRAAEDISFVRDNLADIYRSMHDNSKDSYSYYNYLRRNPLKRPTIFIQVAHNDAVLRNINSEILETFTTTERNIDFLINWNAKVDSSNFNMKQRVAYYGMNLDFADAVTNLAISYIKGEISPGELAKNKMDLQRKIYKIDEARKKGELFDLTDSLISF